MIQKMGCFITIDSSLFGVTLCFVVFAKYQFCHRWVSFSFIVTQLQEVFNLITQVSTRWMISLVLCATYG